MIEQIVKDVMAAAGLACVGWGLWQIWPPISWLVIGAALVIWAVGNPERGGKRR